MTPAQLLAATAADIRRVAGRASAPPWLSDPTGTVVSAGDIPPGEYMLPTDGPMEVAECYRNEVIDERGNNALHIAAWDPDMARAVADWLDTEAAEYADLDPSAQQFIFDAGAGDPAPAAVACRAWWKSRGIEPKEVDDVRS